MTEEERAKVRAEMQAHGITVGPSKAGGFEAFGLKKMDFVWAATEHEAWGRAYGFYVAWKDEYHHPS